MVVSHLTRDFGKIRLKIQKNSQKMCYTESNCVAHLAFFTILLADDSIVGNLTGKPVEIFPRIRPQISKRNCCGVSAQRYRCTTRTPVTLSRRRATYAPSHYSVRPYFAHSSPAARRISSTTAAGPVIRTPLPRAKIHPRNCRLGTTSRWAMKWSLSTGIIQIS